MNGDVWQLLIFVIVIVACLIWCWIVSLQAKIKSHEWEKRDLLVRAFERMNLVVERTYSSVDTGGKPEITIGGETYREGDHIREHVYDEDAQEEAEEDAEDDLADLYRVEKSPFCIREIQEPGPDDHHMAVLATAAKAGPGTDTFCSLFALLYESGKMTTSRTDLAAIAKALYECLCLERVAPDAAMIREKLRAAGVTVQDSLLEGIIDGSKLKEACTWRIRIVDYETGGKFLDRTIEYDESTEQEEADEQ